MENNGYFLFSRLLSNILSAMSTITETDSSPDEVLLAASFRRDARNSLPASPRLGSLTTSDSMLSMSMSMWLPLSNVIVYRHTKISYPRRQENMVFRIMVG